MISYADTGECLRATILQYFGDPAVRVPCGACGNCQPHALDAHDRDVVRKLLSGVARANERYGRRKILAMLVGDTRELPPALAGLSTTGLLRYEHMAMLERWIDAAVNAGLIAVSADKYRTLRLTARGRDVMTGRVDEWQMTAPLRSLNPSSLRGSREYRGMVHRRARFVGEW